MKGCHAYIMLAQIRINEHATGMLNLVSKMLEHIAITYIVQYYYFGHTFIFTIIDVNFHVL